MSNTKDRAIIEFKILKETTEGALVLHYEKEILALVNKFNHSGQSGGSAPYTAGAIADTVRKLCLQKPLCPITGHDDEWFEHDDGHFQNKRLSSVFKEGKEAKPYYIEAIIFKGNNDHCFTGNGVTLKDGSVIGSRQYIKLPFQPKSFYIDVIETEWADKEETVKKVGGGWWTSVVKDESQLDEVFEYYDRK